MYSKKQIPVWISAFLNYNVIFDTGAKLRKMQPKKCMQLSIRLVNFSFDSNLF